MNEFLIILFVSYLIIGFIVCLYANNNGFQIFDGEVIAFWPIILGILLWGRFFKKK